MNTTINFYTLELESTIKEVVNNSTHYMVNINNLEHKYEDVTNGYKGNYLNLLSLISILLTISVIISKNPVVSVLFLIGLFFSVACYLILIGINFIGLSYLLVYVGAVSILFLFILMLINVRVSDLMTNNANSIPLVLIMAILFIYPIQQILPTDFAFFANWTYNTWGINEYMDYHLLNNNTNLYVTSETWDGYLTEMTHITSIGNIMYTNYSMWLIITSIILLLAMIGSIVITVKSATNSDVVDTERNFKNDNNTDTEVKF